MLRGSFPMGCCPGGAHSAPQPRKQGMTEHRRCSGTSPCLGSVTVPVVVLSRWSVRWFSPVKTDLIPSREQQGMETTSFQAVWVLDMSKAPTNEGRKWMGGQAVLGQGWEFCPSLPAQACFLVWFLHYQKLRRKPAPSSCFPRGPRGGGVEAGPRFIQQEKVLYRESL